MWLTVLEALYLWTGRLAYRTVFEFWLKIFGIAFGLGVVSGVVMALEFGTNWSELSRMSGPFRARYCLTRPSRRFFSRRAFSGSCCSAALACRLFPIGNRAS